MTTVSQSQSLWEGMVEIRGRRTWQATCERFLHFKFKMNPRTWLGSTNLGRGSMPSNPFYVTMPMTSLQILQLYDVLQMSLYFAPAFFSHLLGKCLKQKYPIVEVTKLAFVVLGTFALVWWPFLHSYEAVQQVMINYTLLLCSRKPIYIAELHKYNKQSFAFNYLVLFLNMKLVLYFLQTCETCFSVGTELMKSVISGSLSISSI